jgi:signal transduction histidine kinase
MISTTQVDGHEIQVVVAIPPPEPVSYLPAGGAALLGLVAAGGVLVAGRRIEAGRSRLEARVHLAEEHVASKSRFMGFISRELRSPLTAVTGFARILADHGDSFDDYDRAHMIQTIVSQGLDMAYLVEDLLAASGVGGDAVPVRRQMVEVDREVEGVVDQVSEVHGRRIEVIADHVYALADPLRVRQIVRNLLTNAVEAGGSRVYAEVITHNEKVVVGVFDDSPRGQVRDGPVDGIDVGLTVARDLARLMGGDVVRAQRRGWTCHRLELPVAPARVPTV